MDDDNRVIFKVSLKVLFWTLKWQFIVL
jgi:hypothetical protein